MWFEAFKFQEGRKTKGPPKGFMDLLFWFYIQL